MLAGQTGDSLLALIVIRRLGFALCFIATACSPAEYRATKADFLRQQAGFEVLAETLFATPQVTHIGLGADEVLNDQVLIADSLPADSNEAGYRHQVPRQLAFARTSLSEAKYEAIKAQMARLGVLAAYVTEDYVAFVLGGFLDNEYGLVRLRPGRPLPQLSGEFADGVQLVYLHKIRGLWTYFATT